MARAMGTDKRLKEPRRGERTASRGVIDPRQTEESKRLVPARFLSDPVDSLQPGPAVEIGVKTQDRFYPVAFHDSDVNSVARRE